jgi:hypothetical protein
VEIIGAFRAGESGRFILGAINVLVGILLISSPIAAALAVPIVSGVLLLIQGVGLIILAFRVRSSLRNSYNIAAPLASKTYARNGTSGSLEGFQDRAGRSSRIDPSQSVFHGMRQVMRAQ